MSEGRIGGADSYRVISGGASDPRVPAGITDPSAGAGVTATEGSSYHRTNKVGGTVAANLGVSSSDIHYRRAQFGSITEYV